MNALLNKPTCGYLKIGNAISSSSNESALAADISPLSANRRKHILTATEPAVGEHNRRRARTKPPAGPAPPTTGPENPPTPRRPNPAATVSSYPPPKHRASSTRKPGQDSSPPHPPKADEPFNRDTKITE